MAASSGTVTVTKPKPPEEYRHALTDYHTLLRLARRIHAVTAACFECKVMAAFVAYAILG